MSYLLYTDYNRIIQNDNLQQIISNDDTIRIYSEQAAQEEVVSYLIQRYNISEEFKNSEIYSYNNSYNAGQTLQLQGITYESTSTYYNTDIINFGNTCYIFFGTSSININPSTKLQKWEIKGTTYSFSATYSTDDYVIYSYDIYKNIGVTSYGTPGSTDSSWEYVNGTTYSSSLTYSVDEFVTYNDYCYKCIRESFNTNPDSSYFIELGIQNSLFNAKLPANNFDYNEYYNTGDKVYYNNYLYESISQSHNIYPPNEKYWITTTYSVSNELITNTEFFNVGDARSQQMVGFMIDISLYNIHSRVSPRNLPDIRVKRRDDAVKWLKMAALGHITPTFLSLTPVRLTTFRAFSNPKNINRY